MRFATWLRAYMTERHLALDEVARRTGESETTISEWLEGRGPLRTEDVQATLERGPTQPFEWRLTPEEMLPKAMRSIQRGKTEVVAQAMYAAAVEGKYEAGFADGWREAPPTMKAFYRKLAKVAIRLLTPKPDRR